MHIETSWYIFRFPMTKPFPGLSIIVSHPAFDDILTRSGRSPQFTQIALEEFVLRSLVTFVISLVPFNSPAMFTRGLCISLFKLEISISEERASGSDSQG